MKPIINPWVFYFIDTMDTFKTVMLVLFGFSILAFAIFAGFVIYYNYCKSISGGLDEGDESLLKMLQKYSKISVTLLIVSALIGFALPSSATSYKMMAAQMITPNNINTVITAGQDLTSFVSSTVKDVLVSVEEAKKAEATEAPKEDK